MPVSKQIINSFSFFFSSSSFLSPIDRWTYSTNTDPWDAGPQKAISPQSLSPAVLWNKRATQLNLPRISHVFFFLSFFFYRLDVSRDQVESKECVIKSPRWDLPANDNFVFMAGG